jgi:hypothetical protein
MRMINGSADMTSYHFETGGLPKGIYLVSVTDMNGKTLVKKIVR